MFELHNETSNEVIQHPMVTLRGVIIFPRAEIRFVIGRPLSMHALQKSLATDRIIFLATQRDETVENPTPDQIYQVGTLGYIIDSSFSRGAIKIFVESRERASAVHIEECDGYYLVTLRRAPIITTERNEQIAPLISRVVLLVEQYLKLSQDENFYRIRDATQIDDPGQMIDRLADQMYFQVEDKQSLLETYSVCERALRIIEMLEVKIDTLNAKHQLKFG